MRKTSAYLKKKSVEFEPLIFQGFAVTPIYLDDENLALDKKKIGNFAQFLSFLRLGKYANLDLFFDPI